ncbi:NADH-quinone oxidoreductase subunit C [Desulforamulus hydrothermalis]|uniref:NADH-quinone oxidoreductase n=1 Tax=Desulforamulus hydrothermalis Lam5 = DSM 18033 TaxID=1121428 RepID=K8EA52_9FIRM|nr:NADH-quinone oxidoreductase subunit C [Desulforamulus hydrothermalis]CCO08468.1 NADH-quinone oxidoreductase subunit C [Desulforamulus hydrothermalis Lam5 = DSM 18033]SHH29064.1 NADH dehydrogenase subunit C [Desulforamulus hydrothermalis Lam5 = DSM 18033]
MSCQPQAAMMQELTAKYPELEVTQQGYLLAPLGILAKLMRDLKENYGFIFLTNLTAADYLEYFELVYDLAVIGKPDMLHVKCKIDRQHPVAPSMVPIWGGAVWQEREVYDLFGITFQGHPDLRRILLEDSWPGHPLRKDYSYEGGRE